MNLEDYGFRSTMNLSNDFLQGNYMPARVFIMEPLCIIASIVILFLLIINS